MNQNDLYSHSPIQNQNARLAYTHLIKLLQLCIVSLCLSCNKPQASAEDTHDVQDQQASEQQSIGICPSEIAHKGLPDGTQALHHDIDYWIETWASQFNSLEQELLSSQAIEAHRMALAQEKLPTGIQGELKGQMDLGTSLSKETIEEKLSGRLSYLKKMIDAGDLVSWNKESLDEDEVNAFLPSAHRLVQPTMHVALTELQLQCGPYPKALKKLTADQSINRNACTRIKPQAPLEVLAHSPQGMKLVRSRLAIGWLTKDAQISPALNQAQKQDYLGQNFIYEPLLSSQKSEHFKNILSKHQVLLSPLAGTRFPLVATPLLKPDQPEPPPQIWIANAQGITTLDLSETQLQLSSPKSSPLGAILKFNRRNLLQVLFSMLGQQYGLGGAGGGVDCSRLIVNALEPFGLNPPRYSGHQAHMGSFSIDVSQINSDREKLNLLNAAFKQGITLLYLPGHIMVYLGLDQEGIPRVFHAFADYQQVCESGTGETTIRVNRVAVTDLARGQGSSKGSYLSRITRVVVLGGSSGPALDGLARKRVPAPILKPRRKQCRRTKNRARIFTSPHQPHRNQPTRLMVTLPQADPPASLTLFGPNDEILSPKLSRLGGPPFTYYSEGLSLKSGQWRVAYGEGNELYSCTHIEVKSRAKSPKLSEYIWDPQEEWSAHTETLFSAFVEKLFQYPLEEDHSWTNLQDLLMVSEKNLLFNHFSQEEDTRLKLQPDCADLPYTLRAYFAWKLRLPFNYMTCTRGNKRKAPQCMDRVDSRVPREGKKLGDDFQWFAKRGVAGHVHSASARTLPTDDETELYPVALTRAALRPGIVFADPYGHILLIAGWEKQPLNGYGILIGADGQPDGTIGRRRFWEGSFLFDPETKVVGAGFKAFRPLVKVKESKKSNKKHKGRKKSKNKKSNLDPKQVGEAQWRPLSNEELNYKRMGDLAWSDQQYQGSRLDFYDRMNSLSSPRPVEVSAQLNALIEALHESARRRVLSVDNGENWIKEHKKRRMKMPSGYAIFQTAGPWEDFATPSRDMRLLIALDTVLDLPQAFNRNPQRFGVTANEVPKMLPKLKAELSTALKAKTIQYTKSNGESQTLSLWDLSQRLGAFEVAYNPNDCVEIRWGAPQESEEYQTCKRHAPRSQLRKMKRYRAWFKDRKRPPRGTR